MYWKQSLWTSTILLSAFAGVMIAEAIGSQSLMTFMIFGVTGVLLALVAIIVRWKLTEKGG